MYVKSVLCFVYGCVSELHDMHEHDNIFGNFRISTFFEFRQFIEISLARVVKMEKI